MASNKRWKSRWSSIWTKSTGRSTPTATSTWDLAWMIHKLSSRICSSNSGIQLDKSRKDRNHLKTSVEECKMAWEIPLLIRITSWLVWTYQLLRTSMSRILYSETKIIWTCLKELDRGTQANTVVLVHNLVCQIWAANKSRQLLRACQYLQRRHWNHWFKSTDIKALILSTTWNQSLNQFSCLISKDNALSRRRSIRRLYCQAVSHLSSAILERFTQLVD